MSKLRSVAIAGASGYLGKHVLSAFLLPNNRKHFSEIIVLKRASASSSSETYQQNEGYSVRQYDESDLAAALEGVDVLVNTIGSSGHVFKEKLLRAIPGSKVKVYIPSEFGVDHDVHDFPHPEWDQKKHHAEIAKSILTNTRMCRIFIGLFTEASIGPWFGFDTARAKYEVIGSAESPVTYTSLDDVGQAVAAVARLEEKDIPARLHIAGDTLDSRTLAHIMEKAGSEPIEIKEIDLQKYKEQTIAQSTSDPSQFLRFLMGEGKINHTSSGLGNDNDLVNPKGSLWEWKSMAQYAKETGGKPWADFKWDPAGVK